MRGFGKSSVLIAEGGGAGRLSRIDLNETNKIFRTACRIPV